ncbi:polysaccharide deacetylase family protein [Embleya sp. NPDC005971]|uniref:polysaccharide deacetylase family protein n=1 Tax=unclassified Embleya TaxID=2699296 RepID=UPI0033C6487E
MTSRSRRVLTRCGVALGLCLCLATAGCADSATPVEAARPAPQRPQAAGGMAPERAAAELPAQEGAQGRGTRPDLAQREAAARRERAGVVAAARRWGLADAPIAAPAPPATRPVLRPGPGVRFHGDLPAVVHRVPTDERVVFLTIDDGAEKDPDFARMVRELKVPFSAFVSGYLARQDYGYFRGLHEQGVSVNNHTLNHPDLRTLGYARQQQEICRQQDELTREIGETPRLFRPPYGEFNEDTLRAARSCGIVAFPIWNQEAFPDHLEYRYDHVFKPGDIILTHFRGPGQWKGDMTQMLRRVLDAVTREGFALARLDDYL